MSTATSNIWGTNTEAVQGALALLANTMARFQEVAVCRKSGGLMEVFYCRISDRGSGDYPGSKRLLIF